MAAQQRSTQQQGQHPAAIRIGEIGSLCASLIQDFGRTRMIAQRDMHKRRVKDDASVKKQLATDEEFDAFTTAREKFLKAQADLLDSAHALEDLQSTWGLRQQIRKKAKQAKLSTKRHCAHCAGRKARCACTQGCSKPDSSKCLPRE